MRKIEFPKNFYINTYPLKISKVGSQFRWLKTKGFAFFQPSKMKPVLDRISIRCS